MVQESALSKAIAKLGETDRLLVETSQLPDEVLERVAKQLEKSSRGFRFSTAISALSGIALGLGVLILLAEAGLGDLSKQTDKNWWLGGILCVSCALTILALSVPSALEFIKDRSDLRAKLIQGER